MEKIAGYWLIFEQVEKSRHVLLLREKLAEQNKTQELSKLDKEASNKSKKAKHDQEKEEEILNKSDISEDKSVEKWEKDDATEKYERQGHGVYNFTTDGSREQELTAKCLRYILQGKSLLSPPTPKVSLFCLLKKFDSKVGIAKFRVISVLTFEV